MNPSDSENTPDTPAENLKALAASAQSKAQDALQAGQDYAKENPVVLIGGALVLGIVIGLLCGHREPKRKETTEIARDLLDDVLAQISDRLPNFKKASCCPSSILKGCQDAGKKLKWW